MNPGVESRGGPSYAVYRAGSSQDMVTLLRTAALLLCFNTLCCGIAQAQSENARTADTEMQQGYIALREQRFQDAKQHFERAEQLSGTARSAQVDAGIAIAELQMGHYEAARQRES